MFQVFAFGHGSGIPALHLQDLGARVLHPLHFFLIHVDQFPVHQVGVTEVDVIVPFHLAGFLVDPALVAVQVAVHGPDAEVFFKRLHQPGHIPLRRGLLAYDHGLAQRPGLVVYAAVFLPELVCGQVLIDDGSRSQGQGDVLVAARVHVLGPE